MLKQLRYFRIGKNYKVVSRARVAGAWAHRPLARCGRGAGWLAEGGTLGQGQRPATPSTLNALPLNVPAARNARHGAAVDTPTARDAYESVLEKQNTRSNLNTTNKMTEETALRCHALGLQRAGWAAGAPRLGRGRAGRIRHRVTGRCVSGARMCEFVHKRFGERHF